MSEGTSCSNHSNDRILLSLQRIRRIFSSRKEEVPVWIVGANLHFSWIEFGAGDGYKQGCFCRFLCGKVRVDFEYMPMTFQVRLVEQLERSFEMARKLSPRKTTSGWHLKDLKRTISERYFVFKLSNIFWKLYEELSAPGFLDATFWVGGDHE